MDIYKFNNRLVTIGGKFLSPEEYTVTVSTVQHGTVTAVPMSGQYGTTVTLSNTPDSNYQLDYYTVNGNAIVGNTFTLTGDVTVGGSFSYVDPYNPLGLPNRTMRLKFNDGVTPSISGATLTRVSTSPNVWDMYYNNSNWNAMLEQKGVIEVLGANMSTVTQFKWLFKNNNNMVRIALFDTGSATSLNSMIFGCSSLESIPLFPTQSCSDVDYFAGSCSSVQSGARALYQQLSTQSVSPSHTGTFTNCGVNTVTGAAELAQIPSDWKS